MEQTTDTGHFKLLYDLGCAFSSKIELPELIPFVIAKCREALEAEGVSVLLLDRDRNELYFPYVSGDDAKVSDTLRQMRFRADFGIAGAALKSGRPILVKDAQNDSRFYAGVDRETGIVSRSIIAVPLTSRQGPIGVVEVLNRRDGAFFTDDELYFMEAVSGSIAIAIENAQLYAKLRDSRESLRTQVGVLRRDLARHDLFTEMIGTGPRMAEVFRLMEAAAASAITVLIEGETGTGKELVARGIHQASARSDSQFVAVNCAALPESLLESELFGHRRGSFTGAIRDNPGLFRVADGGTVFLDEIADMPAPMQAKLLRVLEEGEVVPVGESLPSKVDVRVVAATNRTLGTEIERGTFREDLYYRLGAFAINLPPLRERRDDIPLLASRFINVFSARHNKQIGGIEREALDSLIAYEWPGNIRQLRNEIDRAVALTREGEMIRSAAFSPIVRSDGDEGRSTVESPAIGAPSAKSVDGRGGNGAGKPLREARAAFEAAYIGDVLTKNEGNVSRAARELGISRPALQEKLKQYLLR
ncbi:MAG: sigma-54-dependent Fis family transcriptional regulator [Candidatus Binataceae bacterium]|nr:sigma-54-dependent Fis family transcriptional regulator [Candidatus Binataceae bacterium]